MRKDVEKYKGHSHAWDTARDTSELPLFYYKAPSYIPVSWSSCEQPEAMGYVQVKAEAAEGSYRDARRSTDLCL